MRRALVMVAVAGLAGCQLIFTLEDEAPVTGSFVYRMASSGPDGQISVVDRPANDVAIQIAFEDDTIDVAIRDDGTFSFGRRGPRYRVFSDVNLNQAEIVETADTIVLGLLQAGRLDIEPVVQPAPVLLPPSTGGQRFLVTTGQWSSQLASLPDWGMALPVGGLPLGLLDGSRGDRVYLIDSANGVYAPNQEAIAAVGSDETVMMAAGDPLDLRGMVVAPVLENTCVTFGMGLTGEVDRLLAASPGFALATSSFDLLAVPSLETGTQARLRIVAGLLDDFGTDFDAPAHDPFEGHASLAQVQILASRPLGLPTSTAAGVVFNGMTMQVDAPRGTCPANRAAFDPQDIAFGTAIAIDDRVLGTDGEVIEIDRPGGAVVTWTAEGRADFFDLVLSELVSDGPTLKLQQRRLYRTREQRVEIEDTLLIPDHVYLLQVGTQIGYPATASGDYFNTVYPNMAATTSSTLFVAR